MISSWWDDDSRCSVDDSVDDSGTFVACTTADLVGLTADVVDSTTGFTTAGDDSNFAFSHRAPLNLLLQEHSGFLLTST